MHIDTDLVFSDSEFLSNSLHLVSHSCALFYDSHGWLDAFAVSDTTKTVHQVAVVYATKAVAIA